MKTRVRALIAAGVVLLLVAGALFGYWWQNIRPTNNEANPVPVYTPTPSTSAPSPGKPVISQLQPTKSATPVPPGCLAKGTPIVPTQMTIDRMKVDSPVLSLGYDGSGQAAAAPPKNASHTTGWFNLGPKPGSDQGKVLLTVHTYRKGGALGNQLNAKDGLKKGDVIKLIDSQGRTVCYSFDHALRVMVKDYDPNSGLIYDNAGKPQVVIVICWDFSWTKETWDSRILFYATPLFSS